MVKFVRVLRFLISWHVVCIGSVRVHQFSTPLTAVGKLGPGDLLVVLTELRDVQADWEDLGLTLKMAPGALRAMKGPFKPHKDCQRDMLTDWLNTSDASWSSLVDALRQPIVGQGNLAAQLERKYLTQAGSGQSTGTL